MLSDERIILLEFEFVLDRLLVLRRIIGVTLASTLLVPY